MLDKQRITAIIATDGSDYSLKAARTASKMLQGGLIEQAIIICVAETTKDVSVLKNLKAVLEKEAEEILERTLAVMPYQENVMTKILYGDPDEKICEYAKENECNLIIMGAKGRSEVMDLLVGSVCSQTVHKAPCSVLLIRNPKD